MLAVSSRVPNMRCLETRFGSRDSEEMNIFVGEILQQAIGMLVSCGCWKSSFQKEEKNNRLFSDCPRMRQMSINVDIVFDWKIFKRILFFETNFLSNRNAFTVK